MGKEMDNSTHLKLIQKVALSFSVEEKYGILARTAGEDHS
jgi:hypothetical protein